MKIFDYKRKAKRYSMGKRRRLSSIEGVCVHFTANRGDTAKNNADYFATGNMRPAGAHIFISADGSTALSVPLRRVAWSVGNPGGCYAPGGYYEILNNSNTISIELCDMVGHPMTEAQFNKLCELLHYIGKKCKNCKTVVRHYDVVKKCCPAYYVENNNEWQRIRPTLESALKGKEVCKYV